MKTSGLNGGVACDTLAGQPGDAFLVITGPTASGKTALSTLLAEQLTIEIINGDVGQFYTPLSIGTAKPNLTEVTVPHHLFDLVHAPESFSAAAYRRYAKICVQDILSRNALPVFVGGSLFYIKSLFFPPQDVGLQDVGGITHGMQDQDEDTFDDGIDTMLLWEKLQQIDPARACAINKNDRYRIVRALAIWRKTGRLPSSCAPVFSPLIPTLQNVCMVPVTRERDDLNRRINTRVVTMFEQGLLDEVATLGPDWWQFLTKKKIIGYHEIIKNGDSPDLISIVQQNTRNYAKRQMTFLRAFLSTMRAIPHIAVIDANLTLCDDYLYIEQIVAWAKKHLPHCVKKV